MGKRSRSGIVGGVSGMLTKACTSTLLALEAWLSAMRVQTASNVSAGVRHRSKSISGGAAGRGDAAEQKKATDVIGGRVSSFYLQAPTQGAPLQFANGRGRG